MRKALIKQKNGYSKVKNSKCVSHLLFDILIEAYNYAKLEQKILLNKQNRNSITTNCRCLLE